MPSQCLLLLIQVLVAVGTNCITVCRFGTDLSRPVCEGVFPGFQQGKQEGKKGKKNKKSRLRPCVLILCPVPGGPCLHNQRELSSLQSLGVEPPPCRLQRERKVRAQEETTEKWVAQREGQRLIYLFAVR